MTYKVSSGMLNLCSLARQYLVVAVVILILIAYSAGVSLLTLTVFDRSFVFHQLINVGGDTILA